MNLGNFIHLVIITLQRARISIKAHRTVTMNPVFNKVRLPWKYP
ncbi:hypothetical protein [Siminovitchia fordii]|nr:hypothetical protein [Siminovitchia fordii]